MNQEENPDRPSKSFEVAFGERLRRRRKAKPGLTLAKFAKLMQAHGSYFDESALSTTERGVREQVLSVREIVAAAQALEIPEYSLLLDDDAAGLLDAYYQGLATGGPGGALAGVLTWATERARAASTPSQNAR